MTLPLLCLLLLPAFASARPLQRGVNWVAATHPVDDSVFTPLIRDHIDWIAQTPFGWQQGLDTPAIHLNPDARWWGESDAGITATARLAKTLGIETLLKPHLWVRSGWVGDIAMVNEADWQTWFAQYRAFILHYAQLAQAEHLAVLCIGTELRGTATRDEDWRALIGAVRQVYAGKLVYSANWYREFEEVQFWDALDYIGIEGYFPLSDQPNPPLPELLLGWDRHLPAIEAVQARFGKPVLITEIGYHSEVAAAIHPWEWETRAGATSEEDLQTQANCYEAFFERFWDREWLAGAYFWKWYPTPGEGHDPVDFTPQHKPAEEVLRQWYGKDRPNSPEEPR